MTRDEISDAAKIERTGSCSVSDQSRKGERKRIGT